MITVKPLRETHMDITVEFPTISKLMADSRKPSVEEKWLVTRSESENGYVVAKVRHLSKPLEIADVVEDDTHSYICGCDGFYYHHAKDHIIPDGVCKHVEAVRKKNREVTAENQETL